MTLRYEVVDVFTDQAFAGNPLAVVLDADDLSDQQLQALAREFNLSETSFPMRPAEGGSYRLRIFTPAMELPFAGHPSVGAASVLHRLGRLGAGDQVQECGAGLLPVHVGDEVTLTGGTPAVGADLDPDVLLAAINLSAEDHVGPPPCFAGTGIVFAYLFVRPGALSRITVDLPAVAAVGGAGLSVVAWDGRDARVRVFAAGAGVPEDPATGSAALGLGVYLAATGLVADGHHDYVVTQGVEMGRPSTMRCSVEVSGGRAVRTTVTGRTVPVARGEIVVPAP